MLRYNMFSDFWYPNPLIIYGMICRLVRTSVAINFDPVRVSVILLPAGFLSVGYAKIILDTINLHSNNRYIMCIIRM